MCMLPFHINSSSDVTVALPSISARLRFNDELRTADIDMALMLVAWLVHVKLALSRFNIRRLPCQRALHMLNTGPAADSLHSASPPPCNARASSTPHVLCGHLADNLAGHMTLLTTFQQFVATRVGHHNSPSLALLLICCSSLRYHRWGWILQKYYYHDKEGWPHYLSQQAHFSKQMCLNPRSDMDK